MTLFELVNNSIDDEYDANSEYEEMIDLVKKDGSLSDADKALISAILIKIATDEDTHNLMLKVIRDVLNRDNHKE